MRWGANALIGWGCLAVVNGQTLSCFNTTLSTDTSVYVPGDLTCFSTVLWKITGGTVNLVLPQPSTLTNIIFSVSTGAQLNFISSPITLAATNNLGSVAAVQNSGKLTFSAAVTFTGIKSSANGAAIYADQNSQTSFNSDATFSNNTATNGAAIYNDGGTISFTSTSSFTANTAALGGAIYSSGGTIGFSSTATFAGNSASSDGGAVCNLGGTVDFSYVSFSSNTAKGYAGAYYNTAYGNPAGGKTTFHDVATFSGNSAWRGGALHNAGGTYIGTVVVNAIMTFTGNSAEMEGGALYNDISCIMQFNGPPTFNENTAATGAGVHNLGILSLDGATFNQNRAGGNGGAVSNSATLTFISATSFISNSAGYQGGGVYNGAGTVNVNSWATFSGNTAGYQGGAVYNFPSAMFNFLHPEYLLGDDFGANCGQNFVNVDVTCASSGINVALIAGVCAGAAVFVILAIGGFIWFRKHKKVQVVST